MKPVFRVGVNEVDLRDLDFRCLSIYRPWPLIIEQYGKRLENRDSIRWLRPILGTYFGLYATKTTDQSTSHLELGKVGVTSLAKAHSAVASTGDIRRVWPEESQATLQLRYWTGPYALVLSDVWILEAPVLPASFGLTGMQLQGLWKPPDEMVEAIASTPMRPAPSTFEVIERGLG